MSNSGFSTDPNGATKVFGLIGGGVKALTDRFAKNAQDKSDRQFAENEKQSRNEHFAESATNNGLQPHHVMGMINKQIKASAVEADSARSHELAVMDRAHSHKMDLLNHSASLPKKAGSRASTAVGADGSFEHSYTTPAPQKVK